MGIFRVILAIAVMFSHMRTSSGETLNLIFGSLTSVRIFFMISGFYMSLIFITKYSHHENGKMLFYSNRALRLYPTYIAILILTMLINDRWIVFNFVDTSMASVKFYEPFSNIFILGQDILMTMGRKPIIGPAWSLGSELTFYLLVPFIILKRPFVVGILMAISISFRVYFDVNGYPNVPWNYQFFPSILIFFLLGHLSFIIYSQIKNLVISRYLGIAGIIFFLAYIAYKSIVYGNFFLPFLNPMVHTAKGYAFYSAITLFIPFLFLVTKSSKIDRFIGNLSYSIYLLAPVSIHLGETFQSNFKYLNIHMAALVTVIIISLCVYFSIEKPIESIRVKRVRERASN